jgi:hypothetical protein
VEIGNEDPLKLAQRGRASAGASERSILGIAKDFTDRMVNIALEKIEQQGSARPTKILVAEPLAIDGAAVTNDRWLQNYRGSLERMLSGKFEKIDFMPEPFAVFQYYRYGIRHALVAQKKQNVALVMDFGGGTFDTCIIETKLDGDISMSGRNSKPLAAHSIAIGGFAVNRFIAEDLLFRVIPKGPERTALGSAIRDYQRLKNVDDLALASEKYAAFVKNYRRLLQSVEQAKCMVCNGMPSWRLDIDPPQGVGCTVEVPTRPLDEKSPIAAQRLDGTLLRRIFEEKIWKQHLLPAIRETIQRAQAELGNKPITIVLLSGGSSNIRWIKPLLERDAAGALRDADILELSENFQEIVAKGLAIECARRYYTEGDGDFRAVTYNRLCLGLNSNSNGLEFKRYIPEDRDLRDVESEPGVLMPSATFLKKFIGQAMRWKVSPTNLPTRNLDYYFMRSSFDTEEVAARQNLDHRLPTPSGVKVGATVGVELLIREDGTAEPSFLYGHGEREGRTTVVKGKPFYLDMTFATEEISGSTYLGLDFGTSTSSISYVGEADIKAYTSRSADRTWRNLSSLVDTLPYPVANPLARFLSATSDERMMKAAREAFEAMLALAVFAAYAEHCTLAGGTSYFIKGLGQCSAGPLWRVLTDMATSSGRRWQACKHLLPLVSGGLFAEIDNAVTQVAPEKHGKKPGSVDWPRTLEQFGNALAKTFERSVFGYFEEARRKRFSTGSYIGIFRSARGHSSSFNDIYTFEGPESFPQEFVFMFDLDTKIGFHLSPLFVRGLEGTNGLREEPDFYMFDIARNGGYGFKAITEREGVTITKEGGGDLYDYVARLMASDPKSETISGFDFVPRTVGSLR